MNSFVIKIAIVGVLVVMGAFYINMLNKKIYKLERDKASLEQSLLVANFSASMCKEEIEYQNEKLNSIRADYNMTIQQLQSWKEKPVKIKYVYKNIIKEIQSDECEDIKSVIDATRTIDYGIL